MIVKQTNVKMKIFHLLIIFFGIILCTKITFGVKINNNTTVKVSKYRLNQLLYPLKYDLELKFDDFQNVQQTKFTGFLKITFRALKNSRLIELYLRDLNIKKWRLFKGPVPIPQGGPTSENQEKETITFNPTLSIETGSDYILELEYDGFLKDNDMKGIFRSSIHADTNLLTNAFPIQCRQILPCFDEPIFKAQFMLTVKNLSNDFHVISNGGLCSKSTRDNTE